MESTSSFLSTVVNVFGIYIRVLSGGGGGGGGILDFDTVTATQMCVCVCIYTTDNK